MRHYQRLFRCLPLRLRRAIDRHGADLHRFVEGAAQQLPAGSVVVDVGAGEAPYRSLFDRARYVGLDFALGDPDWDYSGLDAHADVCNMPLASCCADAALCTQVLEHVSEPASLVAEIYRILRPGGRLYLTAPQGWGEHQQPHDYFRFTSYGLTRLLNDAGFNDIKIAPMGGYFVYLGNRCAQLPKYLLSRWPATRLGLLRTVLQAGLLAVFSGAVPLLCNVLDPLDGSREFTLGYCCRCKKPTSAEPQ